jgi:hypothetical protein
LIGNPLIGNFCSQMDSGFAPRAPRNGAALRRLPHIAIHQLARSTLGFAGVAEELTFEAIELVRRGEEAVASLGTNDDTCGLGVNFDNVAVRHGPWIPQCGQITTALPKGSYGQIGRFHPESTGI